MPSSSFQHSSSRVPQNKSESIGFNVKSLNEFYSNRRMYQKMNFDNIFDKSVPEFKVFSGMNEFKIRRFNEGYIVKPVTSKISSMSTNKIALKLPKSTTNYEKDENQHEKADDSHRNCSSGKRSSKEVLCSFNQENKVKKTTPSKPISFSDSKPAFTSKTSPLKENKIKPNFKANNTANRKSREFFNQVSQAIKLQKIFSIGNNNKTSYPSVRNALKSRGWVEKSAEVLTEEEIMNSKLAETAVRLLKDSPVNFIWVMNSIDFGNVKDDTIVSRFPKNSHFTNKVGLCSFMEEFHWYHDPEISQTVVPRTFKVVNKEDIENFILEFGLTACVSLLKIVVNEVATAESDKFFRNGKVPITVVDFANTQCSEYIIYRQHDNIDRTEDFHTNPKEWSDFLTWFHQIAHENEHFETTSYPMIQAIYSMSKMTLRNIKPYWPQFTIEGCKNLWVVKPSAQFCGRGVVVMRSLDKIIDHLDISTDNHNRHIVQKYIEHPLLIHGSKFDIRQWFLVTSVYPLTIWIYKECYLRFSSQPFTLDELHESIHLTNNAVQRNYNNHSERHPNLPAENMWHCLTFQQYLKDIGEPEKWDKTILPGIKKGIVGVVLASQEEMVERQNSFELYGADFLVGNDYEPILLEINMGPAMAPSTNVTSELCKRGLEDIIKVVLDRRHNPNANTGNFELLYKQEMGPRVHHVGLDLHVTGSKIVPSERKGDTTAYEVFYCSAFFLLLTNPQQLTFTIQPHLNLTKKS